MNSTLTSPVQGRHGTIFPTIEECAATAVHDNFCQRFGSTNIFGAPHEGGYFFDSADSFTIFSLRDGTSPTYEKVARVLFDGTLVLVEPKLQGGDRYFLGGSIYTVIQIGAPAYHVHQLRSIARNGRMPSFLKQCREEGYTIVSENKAKREIVARPSA